MDVVRNRSNRRTDCPVGVVDGRRGAIRQALVQPLFVVEAEVRAQAVDRCRNGGVALQVHLLVLDRSPQPLDEHVVECPPPAIHADLHVGGVEPPGEGVAGELAALIGVEDRRSAPRQGTIQCRTQKSLSSVFETSQART